MFWACPPQDKTLMEIQDILERLHVSYQLDCECLGLEELEERAGEREVWASLLKVLCS